jgi:hypothetical protein
LARTVRKGVCLLNLKFKRGIIVMWSYLVSDSNESETILWAKGVLLGSVFAVSLTTLVGVLWAVVT